MEIAADHSLGFLPFRDRDRLEAGWPLTYIDILTEEIREIRSQAQDLSQPCVVVVLVGDVAVGALLCLRGSYRVREMRIEGLTAESGSRNGRLLDVKVLSIGILRAQHDRTRRSHGSDENRVLAPSPHGAMNSHDELIIASHLRVVGGPVSSLFAFEVIAGLAPVGLDRHVTACAAWGPGEMARVASHAVVGVGQLVRPCWHGAPREAILLQRLRQTRSPRLKRMRLRPLGVGIHGIGHLNDLPLLVLLDHGVLVQPLLPPRETRLLPWSEPILEPTSASRRSVPAGHERRSVIDRSMAIDAGYFDRIGVLAVQVAVAVDVPAK